MTSQIDLEAVVRNANLQRRTGDALADRDRDKSRAAYRSAIRILDSALDTGAVHGSDAAELYGMRGGLFRRLGDFEDAIESYDHGGDLERIGGLPSTYNRANAVKLRLIAGRSTLEDVRSTLVEVADVIDTTMRKDPVAASNAWNYADLGDARLMLGDVPAAEAAYRTFRERARSDSPTTTLAVLGEISRAVRSNGDPGADQFSADLDRITVTLGRD